MLGSGSVMLQPMADGVAVRQTLPAELQQQIVVFLTDLPTIRDSHSQQAFLNSAGLDDALLNQLPVGQPPAQFVNLLVSTCLKYGRLQDGRPAIEAILNAAKGNVGIDRQQACDILIDTVRGECND
jgi:hypothetical protein